MGQSGILRQHFANAGTMHCYVNLWKATVALYINPITSERRKNLPKSCKTYSGVAKQWDEMHYEWTLSMSMWDVSCKANISISSWYILQCFSFFRCWGQNINMNYWWIIRSPILLAVVVISFPSLSLCFSFSCYFSLIRISFTGNSVLKRFTSQKTRYALAFLTFQL